MRKGSVITMLVLVSVGLVAAVAAAKTKEIKTSTTLENPFLGQYVGTVTAKKPCKADRKVTVWHDENGTGKVDSKPPPPDFKIGKALTDANGDWALLGNQAPRGDSIIAVVKPDKRQNDKGEKVKCEEGIAVADAGPDPPEDRPE